MDCSHMFFKKRARIDGHSWMSENMVSGWRKTYRKASIAYKCELK